MDELQVLRTRVGEMAAEIERLQSVIDAANAQEPVAEIEHAGDDGLLPIGAHDHPDCRVMYWSEQELRAIKDYAKRCIAAQVQSPASPSKG